MKYLCHVPVEQYGFISVEVEGTADDAVEAYKEVARSMKSEGIPAKQFNGLLDEYLSTSKVENGGDSWENMSDTQRMVFSEIKRSRARTNK